MSAPDPEFSDTPGYRSILEPETLDRAVSEPDPQNPPDIRPDTDLDPVHPYLPHDVASSVIEEMLSIFLKVTLKRNSVTKKPFLRNFSDCITIFRCHFAMRKNLTITNTDDRLLCVGLLNWIFRGGSYHKGEPLLLQHF